MSNSQPMTSLLKASVRALFEASASNTKGLHSKNYTHRYMYTGCLYSPVLPKAPETLGLHLKKNSVYDFAILPPSGRGRPGTESSPGRLKNNPRTQEQTHVLEYSIHLHAIYRMSNAKGRRKLIAQTQIKKKKRKKRVKNCLKRCGCFILH